MAHREQEGHMRTTVTMALTIAALCAIPTHAMASAMTANGNYQQFAKTKDCQQQVQAELACTLTFAALPSGKNLIVRQVTCMMALTSGGIRYVALESYSASGTVPVARTFISPVLGGGAGFLTATAAVTHVVTAGQKLKVHANTTGGAIFSVECTVVGDLLAP
jgi:hypothetical protein